MIDRIVVNYFTDQSDYLAGTICPKMREYDKGSDYYHFSEDTIHSPIYPLRVKLYPNNRVLLTGSIHKYSNKVDHCNDTDFAIDDALTVLKTICENLKIDLTICDPKITCIEFGVNIKLRLPVVDFLKNVGKYKFQNFSYSKSRSGSTRKWGKELRMTDYDLKFYDKSYLINKELRYKKHPEENLLRFEIAFNHHLKRYLKFDTITGLIKNIDTIPETMLTILNNVTFKQKLNYDKLSIDDIITCEAFNSDEFFYNIKNLPRSTKIKLKMRYEDLLRKLTPKNYSKTVSSRLKRKIISLATK